MNWKYSKNWIKFLRTYFVVAIYFMFQVNKPFPKGERFTPKIGIVNNATETCRYAIKNFNEQDTLVVLFKKRFHQGSYALFSGVVISTNLSSIDSSAFLFNNSGGIVNFFAKYNLSIYDTFIINSKENLNILLIIRDGKKIFNKINKIGGPYVQQACKIKPMPDRSSFSINQINNGWRYQAIIQYRRDKVLGHRTFFPFWAYWVEILCVLAFFIEWPPKLLWSNMRKALR